MKKYFKIIMLLATVAIAFTSCDKSIEVTEEPLDGDFIYSFKIANSDNGNIGTKSTFEDNGSTLYTKWENGDQFGAYAINGSKASNNRPSTVEVDGSSFTLKVSTTTELGQNSQVYTYYPYSGGAGTDASNATINFAALQSQKATGFDASAMPMVGLPFTIEEALPQNSTTTVGQISFLNLGSIIKFNIYSTTPSTEKIQSVSFKANKNLVGNYSINLKTITDSDLSSLALTGGEYSEVTTVLSTPITVGSSKTNGVPVYMVIAPGSYKGSIVVTTDAHTYTFTVNTEKEFSRSRVKPLNADLDNATQGELPIAEQWALCTKATDFTAGTYVIISTDKKKYLKNDIKEVNPASGNAVFSDGELTNVTIDMKWNATNSGNGLVFESIAHEGYFLRGTNTAQGISVSTSTSETTWTFVANSLGGEGGFLATTNNERYLTLYASNNDWRYYKITNGVLDNANNKAAMFYKLHDERFNPELSFSESSINVNINSTYNSVLNNPHSLTVSYSSSNPAVASVNENGVVTTGNVTGEAIITASFNGNTIFMPGSANFTVNVIDPSLTDYTYIFTSKSWEATIGESVANWTSNKDGATYDSSKKGIQVTAAATGANGTSPYSFTNVGSIIVTYCTNASSGAGSIIAKVGNGTAQSIEVTKTGGAAAREVVFTFSPEESGKVNIEVNCTTNSIYIINVTIKAASIVIPPVINITSDNPMSIGNTGDYYTIGYTISNSSGNISSAASDVDWIHDFDFSTSGIIGFTVDAQAAGSPQRTGNITLSYDGANDVIVAVTQEAGEGAVTKEYSFTISSADFNTTSYAANNNTKTTRAIATDGSNDYIDIDWTSNQVMKNGSNMQWQKSAGYLFNNTDLSTIKSVTVNSSAGSFTTYYGTSEHPTSGTSVGNGFFTVLVGGATGTTSSIVIVFKK